MAAGPLFADVRDALRQQYATVVQGLPELDPTSPTDCVGWTVADLETHLALTARGLARIAAAGCSGPADGGGVSEWAMRLPALADALDRAARGERLALAPQVELALEALAAYPESRVVEQLTGRHTLGQAAVFRLVEAVIHGLDAGIQPVPAAARMVVKELTRALADRWPGRTVEVRVPPYAAVQCVEGPRHTRGTPANVVEADPMAWLRVCAGRESWQDLVRTGRIRASGERSDLSGLLPLL